MKRDIIYTFRLMKAQPMHTLLTAAVLLIGIFVTLSTYSFLNVIAFKSLPLPNEESLVLGDSLLNGRREKGKLDPYEARDIKDNQDVFDSLAFYSSSNVSLSFNRESKGLAGVKVDANFFNLVGVEPIKGRTIVGRDTLPDAPQVAVISHELWHSSFLGREDVVGELVRINGKETEIVGIMPKGYGFPNSYEVWIPLAIDFSAIQRGDQRNLTLVGRLKDGISYREANAKVSLIFQRIREQYPILSEGRDIFIEPVIMYEIGPNDMSAFRVMMIAVFGILGLACVNAGGLLLAKMGERQQEIAIRMAMGANRIRIIYQMMLESLILTTLAGIVSLLFVDWYLDMINTLFANIGERIPFWYNFTLDLETVSTAIAIIFLTTIVSSLYPAIRASGVNFNEVLKSGTRGAQSRQSGKLMKSLVSFEIVVASALVISSMIIIITNDRLSKVDFGISTESVLFAQYILPEDLQGEANHEDRDYFQETVRKELLGVPGINSVSFANVFPSQEPWPHVFHEIGEQRDHWSKYRKGFFVTTDRFYFETLDIKLKAGRLPNDLDDHSETNKALVTDSFAEEWWPGEDPIGKRFVSGAPEDLDKVNMEVIGVVSHVVLSEVGSSDMSLGSIFINHDNGKRTVQQVIINVDGDPNAYRTQVKEAFYKVNPDVGFSKLDSVQGSIDKENKQLAILNSFFSAFGIGALILSMTGIYAIMALLIHQKKQEVGIRRALGATNRIIFWWLIREGWTPLIVGLILGISISASFCFLLIKYTQLFNGIGPLIPVVFTAGALFYVLVVGLAIGIPSRKAIKNEPIYALRVD